MRKFNFKYLTSEKGFVLVLFSILLPIFLLSIKFIVDYFIYTAAKNSVKNTMLQSLNESVHFLNESDEDYISHLKAKLILNINPDNIDDFKSSIVRSTPKQTGKSLSDKLLIYHCKVTKYLDEKVYAISDSVVLDGNPLQKEYLSEPHNESHPVFQLAKNKAISDMILEFHDLHITTYNLNYDNLADNVEINHFSPIFNHLPQAKYAKWTHEIFFPKLLGHELFNGIFWHNISVREYEIPSISFHIKISSDDLAFLTRSGFNVNVLQIEDFKNIDNDPYNNFYKFIPTSRQIKKQFYSISTNRIKTSVQKFNDHTLVTLKIPLEIETAFSSRKEFLCTSQIKVYPDSIQTSENNVNIFDIGIAVPVKRDQANLNLYHILNNNIACLVDKLSNDVAKVAIIPYYSKVKLPLPMFNDEEIVQPISFQNTADFKTRHKSKTAEITLHDFFLSEDSNQVMESPLLSEIKFSNTYKSYNLKQSDLENFFSPQNPPCTIKSLQYSLDGEMDKHHIKGRTFTNYIKTNAKDQNATSLFLSSPYSAKREISFPLAASRDQFTAENTLEINATTIAATYDYKPDHNIIDRFYNSDDRSDNYSERNICEHADKETGTFLVDDRSTNKLIAPLNLIKQEFIEEDDPTQTHQTLCDKHYFNPFAILKLSPPKTASLYLRLLNSIATHEESNFVNIGALWAFRMISNETWMVRYNESRLSAKKIIILVITDDIKFKANEMTYYGIQNDGNYLYAKHIAPTPTNTNSAQNSFGVNTEKLIQMTNDTIKNILSNNIDLYVVEILPMEQSDGFPNLKNNIQQIVTNHYGANSVHHQRIIAMYKTDEELDKSLRTVFQNIENNLRIENTLKSTNHHSKHIIIEE